MQRRAFLQQVLTAPALLHLSSAYAESFGEIIDFHTHFLGPGVKGSLPPDAQVPEPIRQVFDNISDRKKLLASLSSQGIDRRILNSPLETAGLRQGETRLQAARRLNDALAMVTQDSNGRLLALATVDTFGGDASAAELKRAVDDLGCVGLFAESAHGDRIIAHPSAQPVLAMAARLRVPVFLHPVQNPTHLERYGLNSFYQTNLSRATINSIAVASLLESTFLDEHPSLQLCTTTFAISALLFAQMKMTRPDAQALMRRHLYVDTAGISPTLMRATIDVLGVERVVVGTDWPIFRPTSIRARLTQAFKELNLSLHDQQLIASGNARRLLKLS